MVKLRSKLIDKISSRYGVPFTIEFKKKDGTFMGNMGGRISEQVEVVNLWSTDAEVYELIINNKVVKVYNN